MCRRLTTVVKVTGAQFERLLTDNKLTNADAARVFGVSPATITSWLTNGPTGAAVNFIAFLIKTEIPPHTVAQKLEIELSPFWREQFDAQR